jgi:hypothetical protein
MVGSAGFEPIILVGSVVVVSFKDFGLDGPKGPRALRGTIKEVSMH